MSVVGVELARFEFGVVLFNVSAHGVFQQLIAVVHFNAERVERVDYLGIVGNDGLFSIGQFGQIVPLNFIVNIQFNFFGIDQNKLDFSGVFFVEQ